MKILLEVKLGDIVNLIRSFFLRLIYTFIGIAIFLIKLIVVILPIYLLYEWNFRHSDKLLEYIKVLIWPLFAFYFIQQYKNELGGFIKRITSIPTPLGQVEAKQDIQSATPPISEGAYKPIVEEKKEVEKKNEDDVKNLREEIDQKDKKIVAERELGFSYYLKHRYEKAYRNIFGSQLSALLALELAVDNIMSYETFHKIYEASELQPSFPFNNWSNFLLTYGFVKLNGLSNTYALTRIGREFINYLRDEKLELNKKPY